MLSCLIYFHPQNFKNKIIWCKEEIEFEHISISKLNSIWPTLCSFLPPPFTTDSPCSTRVYSRQFETKLTCLIQRERTTRREREREGSIFFFFFCRERGGKEHPFGFNQSFPFVTVIAAIGHYLWKQSIWKLGFLNWVYFRSCCLDKFNSWLNFGGEKWFLLRMLVV